MLSVWCRSHYVFIPNLTICLLHQLATCMRCEVVLVDKGCFTGYGGCAWLRQVGIAKTEEVIISIHANYFSTICIPGCSIDVLVLSTHQMHQIRTPNFSFLRS